jgi:hypothetical protein
MNKIYQYTIYEDRGRLPKRIPVWGRGKSGKTSGWEQVHNKLSKILEEFLAGISGKTPAYEQEH